MYQREWKAETYQYNTLHYICCLSPVVHHWIHSHPSLPSSSTFITSITWRCALCHSEGLLPVPHHAAQTHTHRWISNTHTHSTDFCLHSVCHPSVHQRRHFEALCNLDSYQPAHARMQTHTYCTLHTHTHISSWTADLTHSQLNIHYHRTLRTL